MEGLSVNGKAEEKSGTVIPGKTDRDDKGFSGLSFLSDTMEGGLQADSINRGMASTIYRVVADAYIYRISARYFAVWKYGRTNCGNCRTEKEGDRD